MSKSSKRRRRQQVLKAAKKLLSKKELAQKHKPASTILAPQLDQEPVESPWTKRLLSHPAVVWIRPTWKLAFRLFFAFSALVSALGLAFFYPHVDVAIGSTLDPKQPFETRFVLENKSLLPIYGTHYVAECKDATAPIGFTNVWFSTGDFAPAPAIPPYGRYSIYCDASMLVRPTRAALMQVRVIYRPKFWRKPKESIFRFFTKIDSDGNWHWFPADAGEDWTIKTPALF